MHRAQVLPTNPDPFAVALEEGYNARKHRLREEACAAVGLLTPFEKQILRGFGLGLCDKEIAKGGGWTLNTVSGARTKISRKTRIYGRVGLMRLALRASIVSLWCEGGNGYLKPGSPAFGG